MAAKNFIIDSGNDDNSFSTSTSDTAEHILVNSGDSFFVTTTDNVGEGRLAIAVSDIIVQDYAKFSDNSNNSVKDTTEARNNESCTTNNNKFNTDECHIATSCSNVEQSSVSSNPTNSIVEDCLAISNNVSKALEITSNDVDEVTFLTRKNYESLRNSKDFTSLVGYDQLLTADLDNTGIATQLSVTTFLFLSLTKETATITQCYLSTQFHCQCADNSSFGYLRPVADSSANESGFSIGQREVSNVSIIQEENKESVETGAGLAVQVSTRQKNYYFFSKPLVAKQLFHNYIALQYILNRPESIVTSRVYAASDSRQGAVTEREDTYATIEPGNDYNELEYQRSTDVDSSYATPTEELLRLLLCSILITGTAFCIQSQA